MLTPGEVYNDIEVISFSHRTGEKSYHYYYNCKCTNCGRKFVTREDSIKSGHAKSCGCKQREGAKQRWTIHGMTGTKFHQAWSNMKARCLNTNAPYSQNYSLRGITIEDPRWFNFSNFKDDMYESFLKHYAAYGDNTTLDRIDVNKGYYKENCHWVTHQRQDNNKTCTHWITFNGKTQSVSDWAQELNIPYGVLSSRLRRGWDLQRAMTTKVLTKKEQNYKPVICLETGKIYNCAEEASRDNNIPLGTIRKIISGQSKNPRCGKYFQYYQRE